MKSYSLSPVSSWTSSWSSWTSVGWTSAKPISERLQTSARRRSPKRCAALPQHSIRSGNAPRLCMQVMDPAVSLRPP